MDSTEWKEGDSCSAKLSVKVPAFLLNYAKVANRRIEEYNDAQFAPHLNVTVQRRSWPGKPGDKLPVINVPCSLVRHHMFEGVYTKAKVCEAPADKHDGLSGTDRSILCASLEARAPQRHFNSGMILEPMEAHPLTSMFCAGQKLEGQSAQRCATPKKGLGVNVRLPTERRKVSINTAKPNPTQTLALNTLYSSLKRMKSRRGDACMEDLATVPLNGKDSSFSRSFVNKILGVRQGSGSDRREREEVYILPDGKSKPIRLQFKTDSLHLVRENEWGVDLKSREGLLCDVDPDSLALLERFRERYHLISKSPQALDKKLIRNAQFPWARHVVHKGALYEEKDEILENDSGSKLSIHVYLPNAGWEMKENQGTWGPEQKTDECPYC